MCYSYENPKREQKYLSSLHIFVTRFYQQIPTRVNFLNFVSNSTNFGPFSIHSRFEIQLKGMHLHISHSNNSRHDKSYKQMSVILNVTIVTINSTLRLTVVVPFYSKLASMPYKIRATLRRHCQRLPTMLLVQLNDWFQLNIVCEFRQLVVNAA